jgi:hypothetical protein
MGRGALARVMARFSFTAALALTLSFLPEAVQAVPSNDNFASRTTVTSLPYQDSQITVDATKEPGEPDPSCGPIGKTVWYQFTPSSDVVLRVDTRGSDYDTVLSVWTGAALGSLTEVDCSDDFLASESRVLFEARAATTYLFQVGGFEDEGGSLVFRLRLADAAVISGTVTEEGTGAPLPDICVDLVDLDHYGFFYDATEDGGTFRILVDPGNYALFFYDNCDPVNDHRSEWYDNRSNFGSADEVSVAAQSAVSIAVSLARSCPGWGHFPGPQFIGTEGPDTFVGGPEREIFCGLGGADRISGGGGNDSIDGADGRDRLFGGEGRDTLSGGGGRDRLIGGADEDDIFADEGDDQLVGGGGDDFLRGEKGSDELRGGAGNRDRCDGGKGRDRADRSCERTEDIP